VSLSINKVSALETRRHTFLLLSASLRASLDARSGVSSGALGAASIRIVDEKRKKIIFRLKPRAVHRDWMQRTQSGLQKYRGFVIPTRNPT
jgi:hypothetical protein